MRKNQSQAFIMVMSFFAGALIAVIGCCLMLWYKTTFQSKVLTKEQIKQAEVVSQKVNVSEPAAQAIINEIERGHPPDGTYYVQASTLEKAAIKTARQIEIKDKSLPVKALEKTDRTIVTPDKTLNKVDVYKINLRKLHKVKAGVSYIYSKKYYTVGYQAGKIEGLAHFDWEGKPKGVSVLYTAVEW